MTKIFYNGNRIIVDGHAETAEECRAITAMCDSMASNENFKTIIYEEGHAVFEQVRGGDSMMFAMPDFVEQETFDQTIGEIEQRLQYLETQMAALLAKPEYTLPYTAAELVEKLDNL